MSVKIQIPKKLSGFFNVPARYRVAYGGRGSGKSWSMAQMLVAETVEKKKRILCCRELQRSIKDSSHKLIADTINRLNLNKQFDVGETFIRNKKNGSDFIFKGLKHNADEIKSTEGIDICWVEEAHRITKRSMQLLIPTIRKRDSELWFTFNPEDEENEVYQRFVINEPPINSVVVKMNYYDNPWFSKELDNERLYDLKNNEEDYRHIWEGEIKKALEGSYFAKQLMELREDGLITEVPYNSSFPVSTYWDIGMSDYTTCWFVQKVGLRYHLIDYFQYHREDIPFYVKKLLDTNYWITTIKLPHDAGHLRLGMGGKTVAEQFQELLENKIDVETLPPSRALQQDIMATRAFLKRCTFDNVKCEEGLRSLKNYTKKWSEQKNKFEDKPFHNEFSHGADAFRYFAIDCADDMDISEEHNYHELHKINNKIEVVDNDFEFSYI